jgi:type II secretory pathway pseudopilin PulG
MTLIELLVVVSILLMLVLIAIPAVRPGIEGQRTREAARMVNVFVSNARNRAEASGRPYGVEIERLPGLPLAAAVLHQVEVPPPYGGDFQNSRIGIDSAGLVSFPQGDDPYTPGLIQPGDSLKLNYQGHVWVIQGIGPPPDLSNPTVRPWTLFSTTAPAPNTTANGPLPFQIFRQPVRTSATPLQLPRGTVIDLTWSGFATPTSRFLPGSPADATPVRIMFSPNGALWRVWATGFPGVPPTEPVFLLVGRRTRVSTNLTLSGVVLQIDGVPAATWIGPSPAEDGFTNLADPGNFWITIQAQTGLATTADVAAGAPDIALAREEAAKGRPVGGR